MAMTDEEKAIANGTSVQVRAETTRKKTDRSQNDDVVMLTGEELKAQTSKNIGELSKASSNSMPQNIVDATDLVHQWYERTSKSENNSQENRQISKR